MATQGKKSFGLWLLCMSALVILITFLARASANTPEIADSPPAPETAAIFCEQPQPGWRFSRCIDQELRVVCYSGWNPGSVSMQCFPLDDSPLRTP